MKKLPFLILGAWLVSQATVQAKDSLTIGVIQAGWKINHTREALVKKGEQCSVVTAQEMADTAYRLSGQDILLVNEWWTAETREFLNDHQERVKDYIKQGGVLIVLFSLNNPCDYQYWTSSWSPFPLYVTLNNATNDCQQKSPLLHDEIELEGHPLFQGFKTTYLKVGERKAFKANDTRWYILLKNYDHEQPTLLEGTLEKGRFIVVGPALSYWYGKKYHQTLLFDNILAYAKGIARQVRSERAAARKQDSLRTAAGPSPEPSPPTPEPAYQEPEPVYEEPAPAEPLPVETPAEEAYAEPATEPAVSTPYELVPLKTANNWVFDNGHTWSITGEKTVPDKTVYALNFSSGMGTYYISQGPEGVSIYGTSEGGVDNMASIPQLMFKYPASVGDAYQTSTSIGGGEATVTVTGIASQVETAIGTFSCYEYAVQRGNEQQVWHLCPEIGFVKLKTPSEEIILTDYVLN